MKYAVLLAASVAILVAAGIPSNAASPTTMSRFIGAPAEGFSDPGQAVDALKARLAAEDIDGLAKLLGLSSTALEQSQDLDARIERLKTAAASRVHIEDQGPDRKIVKLGDLVYPFPFPLVQRDGAWSFDTREGLEEVADRRIGENELNAIRVCRDYIAAQKVYASVDRDGDNVLEYAQKLISAPGKQDGLYWSADPGEEESPAGPFVDEARIESGTADEGYFGYRFKVLKAQGSNVAGGAYDYVINGNMIAGFAMIAWPVRWGETGIMTFACSHAGIVYERNLGPDTSSIVRSIRRFNPLAQWAVSRD